MTTLLGSAPSPLTVELGDIVSVLKDLASHVNKIYVAHNATTNLVETADAGSQQLATVLNSTNDKLTQLTADHTAFTLSSGLDDTFVGSWLGKVSYTQKHDDDTAGTVVTDKLCVLRVEPAGASADGSKVFYYFSWSLFPDKTVTVQDVVPDDDNVKFYISNIDGADSNGQSIWPCSVDEKVLVPTWFPVVCATPEQTNLETYEMSVPASAISWKFNTQPVKFYKMGVSAVMTLSEINKYQTATMLDNQGKIGPAVPYNKETKHYIGLQEQIGINQYINDPNGGAVWNDPAKPRPVFEQIVEHNTLIGDNLKTSLQNKYKIGVNVPTVEHLDPVAPDYHIYNTYASLQDQIGKVLPKQNVATVPAGKDIMSLMDTQKTDLQFLIAQAKEKAWTDLEKTVLELEQQYIGNIQDMPLPLPSLVGKWTNTADDTTWTLSADITESQFDYSATLSGSSVEYYVKHYPDSIWFTSSSTAPIRYGSDVNQQDPLLSPTMYPVPNPDNVAWTNQTPLNPHDPESKVPYNGYWQWQETTVDGVTTTSQEWVKRYNSQPHDLQRRLTLAEAVQQNYRFKANLGELQTTGDVVDKHTAQIQVIDDKLNIHEDVHDQLQTDTQLAHDIGEHANTHVSRLKSVVANNQGLISQNTGSHEANAVAHAANTSAIDVVMNDLDSLHDEVDEQVGSLVWASKRDWSGVYKKKGDPTQELTIDKYDNPTYDYLVYLAGAQYNCKLEGSFLHLFGMIGNDTGGKMLLKFNGEIEDDNAFVWQPHSNRYYDDDGNVVQNTSNVTHNDALPHGSHDHNWPAPNSAGHSSDYVHAVQVDAAGTMSPTAHTHTGT